MKKEYSIDVWDWDIDYPEEMRKNKEYFPEDLNAIVGIDSAIAEHSKVKKDAN